MSRGLFWMLSRTTGSAALFWNRIVNRQTFPILEKEVSWNAIRETSVFEIDEDTWGMTFQVGLLDAADNVRHATAPKSDPHNWTKQVDTVILNPSWCSSPEGLHITKQGDDWCGLYCDRTLRQMGVAVRTGGTFGEFTDSGAAVLNFTSLTDKGYRYIRHASPPIQWNGSWYAVLEGRNYNGSSPEVNRGNRKLWLIKSTDTFPNLTNWTIVETPIFDPDNFTGKYIGGTEPWSPDAAIIDGKFCVIWWNCNMRGDQDDQKGMNGFSLMYSEATNLDSWTHVNELVPFIRTQTNCGQGDSNQIEDPTFFFDGSRLNIYYNGNADNDLPGADYELGRYQLTGNSPFNDTTYENLFEDNFDDNSIDTSKWDYTPTAGITASESGGLITIAGDGSQTQTLTPILTSLQSWNRGDQNILTIYFDMSRANVAGGNCRIGLFNSDNTKYIAFDSKGASNGQVLKVSDVGAYNVSVSAGTRLKIVISGCYASFQQYTNGEWQDLDPTSTTRWRDISSWGLSEEFFIKVLGANVSGTSYSLTVDDVVLKSFDSPFIAPFIISNKTSSIVSEVLGRYSALTTQEEDALTTFITSCINNGNWWDLVDGIVFKLNATDSLIHMISGTAATNSGATHGANGYSFDGTNDSINSNLNLRTIMGSANNRIALSAYIHTAGNQTSNRTIMSAFDGTTLSRIFYSTTLGACFNLHKASATGNDIMESTFSSDSLYSCQRDYSEGKAQKFFKNGIKLFHTTNGTDTAFSAIPNANIFYGSLQGSSNYFAGTLGAAFIFKTIHDQEAWNTDLRQLITDLT